MSDVPRTSKPIALCLERVASSSADRYVRCTAQIGRALGLALGMDGRILWCEQAGIGCELWVSADQRLMAYCLPDTPPTVLYRAGRNFELPKQKPVVLRHQDELELAGTRFRVHVHGIVDRVHAPTIVRNIARAAAAVVLATVMSSCADDEVKVLDNPPGATVTDADGITQEDSALPVDAGAADAESATDATIEVLDNPPALI